MAPSLQEYTIDDAHALYRSGDLTCRQLVEAFLKRIQDLDRNGPKLNSILNVSPTALGEADELDTHFKATGKFKGSLHGIPVVVKDQAETKGLITTYGSEVARENVPEEDSTVVRKLREQGAVVLGKTSMPDWATSWHSTSSISGTTKNPYDFSRDPGGSSSGTGTAVASNFAILGIGEDTGGSIRLPSSFCGLVGLRCTPGLISRNGLSPLVVPQDTPGPMARTVRDVALMLDAIAGYDDKDPYTATAVLAGIPAGGSYAADLDAKPVSQARIGVLRSVFGDGSDPENQAVITVIHKALGALQQAGAELIDVDIPNLQHYLNFTSVYYSRSRSDLDRFLATKPHLDTTCAKIHSEGRYHKNLDLFQLFATGPAVPSEDPEYLHRLEDREFFQRLIIGIMASQRLDAIAFPDCQIPAPTTADVLESRWTALDFLTNTIIASQAHMPAITVPAGLTEGGGLPVGLELMGLPLKEQELLRVAYGVEQVIGPRKAPQL